MKTTSLAKAPIGSIVYVIAPNQQGYTELVNVPVGKVSFQELIDGMKTAIGENEKRILAITEDLTIVQAEFELYKRKSIQEIADLQSRLKAIEQAEVIL